MRKMDLHHSGSTVSALLFVVIMAAASTNATEVEVQALFTNAAMLKINGQSKVLKVGQSLSGVTLLEADSRGAVIDLDGQRRELGVSGRISGSYSAPEKLEVRIPRDAQMQYLVRAEVNGRRATVLVDTGANLVAMNSSHARSLGIDFASGTPAQISTASGRVPAWMVTLESVNVGGLRVNSVQASVIEGGYPETILLGMTYLRHIQMQEKNGVLLLSRDY